MKNNFWIFFHDHTSFVAKFFAFASLIILCFLDRAKYESSISITGKDQNFNKNEKLTAY
jgi:hypothetical protein